MEVSHHNSVCRGHTLMELVTAMVCSAVLLAGLGSVMMIGSRVAYTPSAANRRTQAADVVNQIVDELRYATIVVQQTPQILEFVVADRNSDGTAEKIRYEWSGEAGAALYRRFNAGMAVAVLDSVHAFSNSLSLKSTTTTVTTTVDSAETLLLSNTNVQSGTERDISSTSQSAHVVNPAAFGSIPANAISWNATKLDFQGRQTGANSDTLLIQLRSTGELNDGPTSSVAGQVTIPEATLTSSMGWNTAVLSSTARNLAFHRRYAIVWLGASTGVAARVLTNDSLATGVLESNDGGASWQFMATRQMFGRLYGTYTTPGPSYNVTRSFVSHVGLLVQAGDQAHARIDASIPLENKPELLATYWRADFDRDPTTTNANGDSAADWVLTGGGSFDSTKLINGVWYATGALETRPLADFATTTIVEARCRNSSVGGNGAVVRINADRQGAQHAPIVVYVQRQADDSQTLTLLRKPSDNGSEILFSRPALSSDLVRFQLTILPQYDVVNLQINGEDQGTFSYKPYTTSSNDRFLTLYADTSVAEFDYVDVRVGTN